jgi:hypothetical protein
MAGLHDYAPASRARYPQNQGMLDFIHASQQRQAAMDARLNSGSIRPYRPSYGDPNLTGGGRYGLEVAARGLMTNQGAQGFQRQYGYMPNTTVGGAYGNPGGYDPNYAAQAGQRAASIAMRGPGAVATDMRSQMGGYARGGGQGLGYTPTDMQGYAQQMQAQNPGGVNYGALPTMITTGGLARPGYASAPGMPEGLGLEAIARGNAALAGHGYEPNALGQMVMSPGNTAHWEAVNKARETFDARRGGLAARVADYEARTAEAKRFREGNRVARGMQRGRALEDTVRANRGLLSMGERFMFQNPQAYARTVEAQNLGQYQQGLLGVQQRGLESRERIAGLEGATQRGLAQLAGQNAMGLAGLQGTTAKEIAALQGQNQMGLAGVQAGAQKDIAGIQGQSGLAIAREQNSGRRDEMELKRQQFAQQRADSLRAQARESYNSGDIQGAQYYERLATQQEIYGDSLGGRQPAPGLGMPTGPTAGVPQSPQGLAGAAGQAAPQGGGLLNYVGPQVWAQLPFQAREKLRGTSPMEMVQNIRNMMPELPQAAMDQMVAEAYPGTSATQYNPDGYDGWDFLGGLTGLENVNRFGRAASGRGPKPPMMNVPFVGERPIPVIPGIGWAQTRAGY